MSNSILTPTITDKRRYILDVSEAEFNEICYALEVLSKKRESARQTSKKKYELKKQQEQQEGVVKREYRRAVNLVIAKPPSPPGTKNIDIPRLPTPKVSLSFSSSSDSDPSTDSS